jgi:hypothetical protein
MCRSHVQIGCADRMCRLDVQIACADWMCRLHVQIACADWMCRSHVQIACADWMCRSHVQIECADRMCRSHVQIGCADRMCRLDVQIVCADRMCRLDVQIACADWMCRLDVVHCSKNAHKKTHADLHANLEQRAVWCCAAQMSGKFHFCCAQNTYKVLHGTDTNAVEPTSSEPDDPEMDRNVASSVFSIYKNDDERTINVGKILAVSRRVNVPSWWRYSAKS